LLAEGRQYVYMNGREIFKHAVREMSDSALQVLQAAGVTVDNIALVIPHQANVRIIDAVARRLEIPPERVMINLDRYGNTSAASIPIALYEAACQERIKAGDYVLLMAFGRHDGEGKAMVVSAKKEEATGHEHCMGISGTGIASCRYGS